MTTLTLHERFNGLAVEVSNEIHERSAEVHTAVLALLSSKHHFQLGPPGTAKSLLVERIVDRIDGFGDGGYFRWLLTRFTAPEEIFGAPEFLLLKEKGIYKRNTSRKLPVATIAFLDEIFKASSSILNALLTAMNEREFYNMEDDNGIPLNSIFSASNELPDGDELGALWDRLHFRHVVREIQETSNFVEMLATPMVAEPAKLFSLDDLAAAQAQVNAVRIPMDVLEALKGLRQDLIVAGVMATDRRWMSTLPIIKAEAWLQGEEVADVAHMRPLMHVLWEDLSFRKEVTTQVLSLANPIDKVANELLDDLAELDTVLKRGIRDHADNPKAKAKVAVEIHGKLKKVKNAMGKLVAEAETVERPSEKLDSLKKRFAKVARDLMVDGFNMEEADVPGTGT